VCLLLPSIIFAIPNGLGRYLPPNVTEERGKTVAQNGDDALICASYYSLLALSAAERGDEEVGKAALNHANIMLTAAYGFGGQIGLNESEVTAMYHSAMDDVSEQIQEIDIAALAQFCYTFIEEVYQLDQGE